MAVPTVAADSTIGGTTDLHSVTVPAHAVDDITIIFAFNRNSGSSPLVSWENATYPFLSGGTVIGQFDIPSFQGNMLVVAKREAGTGSYSVGLEQENSLPADLVMGYAICVRGVDPALSVAEAVRFEDSAGGNTTDISLSGISVDCDTRDTLALLFVATVDDRDMAGTTGESGGDWGNLAGSDNPIRDGLSTAGSDGAIGVYGAAMSGGGTISGGTVDISGAGVGWGVMALAIAADEESTTVGRSLETSWDVDGTVGRSLETSWDIAGVVGKSLETAWSVFSGAFQWPDRILQVDWDNDGWGDEIDNRTSDFKSISWSRGADKAGPGRIGTATITVNDFDGTYVDTNVSSPLFGKLKPGSKVWVTANWEGLIVGIFAGYIDEIVPMPHTYEAQIICSDLFKRAAEVVVRPPSSLVTVRDAREWVLDQLGVAESERAMSVNEGQTLHRVPSQDTAMGILEQLNNSMGSTHVMIPGATSADWQRYTVIDRHHGIKQVIPDVTADGTEQIKREGFHGWRTTLSTIVNRVRVSGEPPPSSFDAERSEIWVSNERVYVDDGETQVVWADFGSPAIELQVQVAETGGALDATVEAIGFDTAKITLEGLGAGTTAISKITLTGRRGNRPDTATFEVDNPTSQATYDLIKEGDPIDSSYVGSAIANGAAEHVVHAGGDPRKEPAVFLMDDFFTILSGDIGTLTSVTLERLFVEDRRMRINGIDGDMANGVVWSVSWQMIDEQQAEPDLFILDVSELDEGVLGR